MIRALQEHQSGYLEGEYCFVFPWYLPSQRVTHLQELSKHAYQLKKLSRGTRNGGDMGSVALSYTGVSKTCTRVRISTAGSR